MVRSADAEVWDARCQLSAIPLCQPWTPRSARQTRQTDTTTHRSPLLLRPSMWRRARSGPLGQSPQRSGGRSRRPASGRVRICARTGGRTSPTTGSARSVWPPIAPPAECPTASCANGTHTVGGRWLVRSRNIRERGPNMTTRTVRTVSREDLEARRHVILDRLGLTLDQVRLGVPASTLSSDE